MHPIPKTFSVRDLQRNYRSVINAAKEQQDAVMLINNSTPEAVILDIDTYSKLLQDDYAFDEAYTLKLIGQAKKSYRSGLAKKLTSWDVLDR